MSDLARDRERRDAWLAEKTRDRYKHLVYVGAGVTIADVERWLREALRPADDTAEAHGPSPRDPALSPLARRPASSGREHQAAPE